LCKRILKLHLHLRYSTYPRFNKKWVTSDMGMGIGWWYGLGWSKVLDP